MVRTQVQLEERQVEAIRRMASARRISMAEAVRRLVAVGLREGIDEQPPESGAQALLAIAGIARSGLTDLGRRHDDYLAEDFER